MAGHLLLMSAEFVELDAIGCVLWVLRSRIVAVLAASTFESKEWAVALWHWFILLWVL